MTRKVLLIDDQRAKSEGIKRFFKEIYPSDDVKWTKNFRQAQNNLRHGGYDLVILDMSFEVHGATSEDMRFNGLAGLHVLQFMWRSKIKVPTIICTSHVNYSDPDFGKIRGLDGLKKYVRVFGSVVIGCVLMEADEKIWHREMNRIIKDAGI
ncbi:MAG: response regulator [Hyphomicrobiales bacterium]|nr:response regulator [Hyphomicrobiales bacterium]